MINSNNSNAKPYGMPRNIETGDVPSVRCHCVAQNGAKGALSVAQRLCVRTRNPYQSLPIPTLLYIQYLLCTGHTADPHMALPPFSAKHVARICRVLRRPAGHVALIGRSAAGLQSLARTAVQLCHMALHEVRKGCLKSGA